MFALMAAVNYNYSGVVTVMLDNGADPNKILQSYGGVEGMFL